MPTFAASWLIRCQFLRYAITLRHFADIAALMFTPAPLADHYALPTLPLIRHHACQADKNVCCRAYYAMVGCRLITLHNCHAAGHSD